MGHLLQINDYANLVQDTFKVVDACIDARLGNSRLVLPDSSFDTSFDNDKPFSFLQKSEFFKTRLDT